MKKTVYYITKCIFVAYTLKTISPILTKMPLIIFTDTRKV